MVNFHKPHVYVLPEDRANRQMADAFRLEIEFTQSRQMMVLPKAGGWPKVFKLFKSVHIREMEACRDRYMILLIDFDCKWEERINRARSDIIPAHLTDRVFILGAWKEPEDLMRANLGTFEEIGKAMARDCRDGTDNIWMHELLRHNASELDRLREHVRPILF